MDRCRMNQQGHRPCYPPYMPSACEPCMKKKDNMYEAVDKLPLAMAYVPWQTFYTTFDLCKALNMGTIFPELCKPFCGKRGSCR